MAGISGKKNVSTLVSKIVRFNFGDINRLNFGDDNRLNFGDDNGDKLDYYIKLLFKSRTNFPPEVIDEFLISILDKLYELACISYLETKSLYNDWNFHRIALMIRILREKRKNNVTSISDLIVIDAFNKYFKRLCENINIDVSFLPKDFFERFDYILSLKKKIG